MPHIGNYYQIRGYDVTPVVGMLDINDLGGKLNAIV